jgi:hypothetical protein
MVLLMDLLAVAAAAGLEAQMDLKQMVFHMLVRVEHMEVALVQGRIFVTVADLLNYAAGVVLVALSELSGPVTPANSRQLA